MPGLDDTRRVPWAAPVAAGPVDAAVELPGSKSLTNRALVLAALADGPSLIRRALRAADTELMVAGLRSLGAEVDTDSADWKVTPQPLTGPARVDCGLAGTVARFLPAVAPLGSGPVRFDGPDQARRRPIRPLLDALRALGAEIVDDGGGALPFTVRGHGGLPGGTVQLDASASSQFVSALLLAGACYERGVDVRHRGGPLPSRGHVALTVAELRRRGVRVEDEEAGRWRVSPGRMPATDVAVEPDLSTAAPFAAAALVTGGTVTLAGWPRRTVQPGDRLRDLLSRLGAKVERSDGGLMVSGPGEISGLDVDLRDAGELAPVLAAVCALGATPSTLSGIAHLRGHESDRLAALATELSRLGTEVAQAAGGLRITPRPLRGGLFRAYGDHRMVHAGAVLGLRVPGLVVDDVAAAAKTHPDFAGAWSALVR